MEKLAFITELDQSETSSVGSRPLIQDLDQSEASSVGSRPLIQDVDQSEASSVGSRPLIQEVDQSERGSGEGNLVFDMVREEGGRIPRSWEILEENKRKESQGATKDGDNAENATGKMETIFEYLL